MKIIVFLTCRNYQITKLVKLCGPYIQKLSIRSLIPSDIPVQRMVSPEMANLITSQEPTENKNEYNFHNKNHIRGKTKTCLLLMFVSYL